MDATDHAAHERRLAEALRDLVRQIDLADYRDSLGHPAKSNLAVIKAQALCDEFCVSHEDICAALDRRDGDDLAAAARWLQGRAQQASPPDQPPEYQVWRSGP
jgi:DNA-binding GntR family transcriptional regulator